MKTTLLLLVAAVSGLTSLGSFAGRTGDQIILQERENKRVAEEKREMQEMLKRCSAMMETMDRSN